MLCRYVDVTIFEGDGGGRRRQGPFSIAVEGSNDGGIFGELA